MSTVQFPTEHRFLLPSVSWRTYERLLRAFSDRPGVRLTYDRGVLEIMTLSREHENRGHLLGRFVVVLTEELGRWMKTPWSASSGSGCGSDSLVRGQLRLDMPPFKFLMSEVRCCIPLGNLHAVLF